jgi:hypothetical protein
MVRFRETSDSGADERVVPCSRPVETSPPRSTAVPLSLILRGEASPGWAVTRFDESRLETVRLPAPWPASFRTPPDERISSADIRLVAVPAEKFRPTDRRFSRPTTLRARPARSLSRLSDGRTSGWRDRTVIWPSRSTELWPKATWEIRRFWSWPRLTTVRARDPPGISFLS